MRDDTVEIPTTVPDWEISRLEDRRPSDDAYTEDYTLEQFCGDWATTNNASRGIVRAKITRANNALIVHVFGASANGPVDWGAVPAEVFADAPNSTRIRAFHAFYDFGFMETHIQAKTEKAVLVLASFNRFKDQSGRANYFSREFLHGM